MMMKKFIVFTISIILLLSLVSALDNYNCENLESQKDLAIGQKLPEKAPFSDEIMNIYVGEESYGNLIIENKTISNFSCTENENATYEIIISDLNMVEEFISSKDILQTYKDKSDSGEITIKGKTLSKKIKLGFVKFFLKFI